MFISIAIVVAIGLIILLFRLFSDLQGTDDVNSEHVLFLISKEPCTAESMLAHFALWYGSGDREDPFIKKCFDDALDHLLKQDLVRSGDGLYFITDSGREALRSRDLPTA